MTAKRESGKAVSRGRQAVERERLQLDHLPPPPAQDHPIGDEVDALVASIGLQAQAWSERLMAEWHDIVGAPLARHTRPGPVRRGVLTVYVSHSTWLSHLSRFGLSELRERVRALCGEQNVRDVRLALDPDIPGARVSRDVSWRDLFADQPGTLSARATGRGFLLRADHPVASSRWSTVLGPLSLLKCWTALYRHLPWWNLPCAGADLAALPVATDFLLTRRTDGVFALYAPLPDHESGMLSSLAGDARGRLVWTADSGDDQSPCDHVAGLYVASGDEPYDLLQSAAADICHELGLGRLRREKPRPTLMNGLGWCTWDAFYAEVSHNKVRQGLDSFRRAGVPLWFMVLDDGWLDVAPREEYAPERRLVSFEANGKFPGGLRATADMARAEFGLRQFLVWHAAQGTWGGIDPKRLAGYETSEQRKQFSPGLLMHFPEANDIWHGDRLTLVTPRDVARFYQDFHRALAAQGVDGVKVDAQNNLEAVAGGQGGVIRLMAAYREAIEGAAQAHFGGELINCMCCSPNRVLQSRGSIVLRSSNDFLPDKNHEHGRHVYANAVTGAWYGQFMQPDWDMFWSDHPFAGFHAAARAVSGGPVYVSDPPDRHDAELLSRLVLSDGRVPLALDVGRPTPDCLFVDPTADDVLYKIFNHNVTGAVVGIFHCGWHEDEGEKRRRTGRLSPRDVPGLRGERFACLCAASGDRRLLARGEALEFELGEGGWEVVALAPIEQGVAVLGFERLLNAGGAVESCVRIEDHLAVTLRDEGDLLLYRESSGWETLRIDSDGFEHLVLQG